MTDKELRKLHKYELIKLLYNMRKELEDTQNENENLKKQLDESLNSSDELLELVKSTAENVKKLCKVTDADKIQEFDGEI